MQIKSDVAFASYTTLGVGGRARYWCECRTLADVMEGIEFAQMRSLPIFILAGGSNVVGADSGFPGLVLHISNRDLVVNAETYEVTAGAGLPMAELVYQSTERGWQGLEWAGGLPGSLGGAIRGNAGSFGGEIADRVVSVLAFDVETRTQRILTQAECRFGYRASRFKSERSIIWQATLRFSPGNSAALAAQRDECIRYRQTKHPHEPSAGSVFQNLLVRDLPREFFVKFPQMREKVRGGKLAAGALLDTLGFKERRVGDAAVSRQHANMIINLGAATGADVRALAQQMKTAVYDRFGLMLSEEQEFLKDELGETHGE